MPSVWFINPRIVANLKALATRNRGGGSKKTDEKGEEGQKGEKDEEGEGGGGEEAKTRGRESTQDLGR